MLFEYLGMGADDTQRITGWSGGKRDNGRLGQRQIDRLHRLRGHGPRP